METKTEKENKLQLIPKTEKYIEYMLQLITKLPRVEKFNIGNEYKLSMYEMLRNIMYLSKIEKSKCLEIANNIDAELNTQRIYLIIMKNNKWIDESKRFEETFNKFVSSRDVNSTDQYKSELDKLLKSNEWNCVYRLYVYDDENIFSEPVYTYQVKGGTSNFETSGQTEKNGKGQVLYYRLKLKDIVSTKIVETVKIISIYTTLIFFVIFMILKRQYKKL